MQRLLFFLALVGIIGGFIFFQNNALVLTELEAGFPHLPQAFDGLTIVHLSDLHGKRFGPAQGRLITTIEQANPHLVIMTGDMVDSRWYRLEPLLVLVDKLQVPVFYAMGNHELSSGRVEEIQAELEARGVHVLRNQAFTLTQGDEEILIIGVDDPCRVPDPIEETLRRYLIQALEDRREQFTLLLAHRPELFSLYRGLAIDLAFSGHVHGGQIRFPFIGPLAAPGQGPFPPHTSGLNWEGRSGMVVSRGLGNSLLPLRTFNRPEVMVITLRKEIPGG